MTLNWDDLKLVLALERAGTMSAAASALGVNHSTISRRMASMQEALGTTLFERSPTGWRPTDAGTKLVEVAARMEAEVSSLDAQLIGQDEQLSGTVRLATVDIMALELSGLVATFRQTHPNILLNVVTGNDPISLTRREADVALRITNAPPEHLIGRRLGRMTYSLYASRALTAQVGTGPLLRQLEALPWLMWDESCEAHGTQAWMQRHVPRAKVVCYLDSTPVMRAYIERGVGVGFMPRMLMRRSEEVVSLLDAPHDFGVDLWLLTHPDLKNTRRIKAVMDALDAQLRPRLAPQPLPER